jgi:hypothetical protein
MHALLSAYIFQHFFPMDIHISWIITIRIVLELIVANMACQLEPTRTKIHSTEKYWIYLSILEILVKHHYCLDLLLIVLHIVDWLATSLPPFHRNGLA